jgi:hypothetical protein
MTLAMQVLFFLYFLQDEDSAAIIGIGADKNQKPLSPYNHVVDIGS